MEYTHQIKCSKCKNVFNLILIGQNENKAFVYKQENENKFVGKICHDCKLKSQSVYRDKNNNVKTKEYEKSPQGFLMRMYRNMKSRITGVQKAKHHLYVGKYLLPKEEFYQWALNNDSFAKLYADYAASGFVQKLAPSVDRIDPEKGYEVSNMEFVTHSENSRRGAISQARKLKKP